MIDLRAITKKAINVGFDLAGQLTISTSYNRVSGTADATYSTATGVVTPNTRTIQPVTAMVLRFAAKEIDGEKVRSGDERVLVRTAELPALGEPARDDYLIEISSSVRRDVIEFAADPTHTFWILHCRRNSG